MKFSNSYISIGINEINYDKLEDIVYNKFNTNISTCDNCSYIKDENEKTIDIKSGQLYKTCFTKTVIDIELPYILSFIIELTNLNDNSDTTQHNIIFVIIEQLIYYSDPLIFFCNYSL